MSSNVQTAIRLPREFIERAEALRPFVERVYRSGGRTTQSDVLRSAIERGLAELERHQGTQ